MAKIATCPTCAKQLGLPDSISATDRVECPECHAAFSLSETVQISLPVAQVLAPAATEPDIASPLLANLTSSPEPKLEVPTPTLPAATTPISPISKKLAPSNQRPVTPSTAAPLQQSWEERLRNVLAKGDSSGESVLEQESQTPVKAAAVPKITELINEKPTVEAKKQPVPSPLSDLNLNLEFDSPAIAKTVTPELAKKTTVKPVAKAVAKPVTEPVAPQGKPESKSELLDRTLQEASMPQMAMVAPSSKPKPPAQKTFELKTKSKIAPGKTLAELSTSSAGVSLELGSPVAQPVSAVQATKVATMTVTKKTAAKPVVAAKAVTEKTLSTATKTLAEVAPKIDPHRRLARRGFPKVAAFAVGPVAGCLLGLYGLLWLQGARADHVGFGKLLPVAMLPASVNEAYCTESLFVETDESATELEVVAEDKSLVTFQSDSAVTIASAELPVKQISPLVQIRIDEFSARVEAASIALPNLVSGDFSTRELIRTKGQAYMTLCQLAEQFAEQFDLSQQPGVRIQARQAKELYRQAVEQASTREELAHIAGEWWLHSGRTSPGIFLAGQIQRTEPTADGTICWVKLSQQSNALTIPVWFQQDHFQPTHSQQGSPQTGDTVGIVGHITDSLAAFPAGFTGSQVVVASYNFSLAPAP